MEVIVRELRQAVEAQREVVHIRVSQDAISGCVLAVPLAPERLRTLAGVNTAGKGLLPDPKAQERLVEIVVHPDEWIDMMLSARNGGPLRLEVDGTWRFMSWKVLEP